MEFYITCGTSRITSGTTLGTISRITSGTGMHAPSSEHIIDCWDGRESGGAADLPSTTGMDKHLPLTGGMGVHPGTDLPSNAGIGVGPVVKLPSAGGMGVHPVLSLPLTAGMGMYRG